MAIHAQFTQVRNPSSEMPGLGRYENSDHSRSQEGMEHSEEGPERKSCCPTETLAAITKRLTGRMRAEEGQRAVPSCERGASASAVSV